MQSPLKAKKLETIKKGKGRKASQKKNVKQYRNCSRNGSEKKKVHRKKVRSKEREEKTKIIYFPKRCSHFE